MYYSSSPHLSHTRTSCFIVKGTTTHSGSRDRIRRVIKFYRLHPVYLTDALSFLYPLRCHRLTPELNHLPELLSGLPPHFPVSSYRSPQTTLSINIREIFLKQKSDQVMTLLQILWLSSPSTSSPNFFIYILYCRCPRLSLLSSLSVPVLYPHHRNYL